MCRTRIHYKSGAMLYLWRVCWHHHAPVSVSTCCRTGVCKPPPVQLNLHQLDGTVPTIDSPFAWLTVPVMDLPVRARLKYHGRLIFPLLRSTHPWLISAAPWWSSTPRCVLTGLNISGEIQYIFILYIAFFTRAITPGCKSYLIQDPKSPCWCKFKGHQKISSLKRKIPV